MGRIVFLQIEDPVLEETDEWTADDEQEETEEKAVGDDEKEKEEIPEVINQRLACSVHSLNFRNSGVP